MIKKIIKKIIPEVLVTAAKNKYYKLKSAKAKKVFDVASASPDFLNKEMLEQLHRKYKFDTYVSYDADALLLRGAERAEEMKQKIGAAFSSIKTCLEIGCGDGMVSSVLSQNGIRCTALDYDNYLFDKRAAKNNVEFIISDAAKIPLESETFDFVFSYNSFEHISKPDDAFIEALRMVKKNGYLFLSFNPLYPSTYGFHAYKSTQIPYLQIMFRENDIVNFISENNLPDISFSLKYLNKWSITQFRELWKKNMDKFTIEMNNEIPNYFGVDLISKYPSCFKSKSTHLDDFIISGIELLVRKK